MKYEVFRPCIFIEYWIFHIWYVGYDHNNMYNMSDLRIEPLIQYWIYMDSVCFTGIILILLLFPASSGESRRWLLGSQTLHLHQVILRWRGWWWPSGFNRRLRCRPFALVLVHIGFDFIIFFIFFFIMKWDEIVSTQWSLMFISNSVRPGG